MDHPEWGLCLPGELAALAAIAWEEIIDVQVSAAQREVSVLLEEAGIAHELEHRTEGSMRSIDCALPHLKLAIEVSCLGGQLVLVLGWDWIVGCSGQAVAVFIG